MGDSLQTPIRTRVASIKRAAQATQQSGSFSLAPRMRELAAPPLYPTPLQARAQLPPSADRRAGLLWQKEERQALKVARLAR